MKTRITVLYFLLIWSTIFMMVAAIIKDTDRWLMTIRDFSSAMVVVHVIAFIVLLFVKIDGK